MPGTQEIFEAIYRNKLWGGRKRFWQRFYSGSGSYAIGDYINAVAPYITGNNVVDIGCGDFRVGRRLVKYAKRYIACDIVRPLIQRNSRKFKNVEFRVLDAAEDILPDGDVVMIRQVLQHLDNGCVSKVVHKLSKYKLAIITEHVPRHNFKPNVDMASGAGNRNALGSGIVLSEPPFGLAPGETIYEVPEHGGLIKAILYRF